MKHARADYGLVSIVVIVVCFLAFVATAGAEQLKWRESLQIVKSESIEVGDVPGHILGLAEVAGLASLQNGEVARVSLKAQFDYTKGSGVHREYTQYLFEDGSTFVTKGEGTTKTEPGATTSSITGKASFVSGTGRFSGVKGEVSWAGKRLQPLPGIGAPLYFDSTATYTVSR